ncbi:MAG: DNA repair protein RadC, partial [Marinobacter adhaerens]|nr:DNA repair protein RadC [Marinobacter adhaerens]
MSDPAWPTDERPRERLLAHGPQTLSDAELLALFLRTGTTGMPVMALARHLIEEFSGLRGLLTASRRQFCDVKGLGTAKYAQVQAAMEMARRVMDEPLRQGDPLRSPEDTRRFLTSRLGTYPHEVFAGLFLDNRHRVIQYRELFRGTIDGAAVYPREVVRQALE